MKSVIACDVAPIKKVRPQDMSKYEAMALGSPIWFERDPANVKIFTQDMPRMEGKHSILFNTHGEAPTSHFWSMSKNILKKGMIIIGKNDWYGPDRISAHHDTPHMGTGHADEIDLMETWAFGRQMAEYSVSIYAGEKELIPEIPDPLAGDADMWSAPID